MALESCEGGELFDQITRVSFKKGTFSSVLFLSIGRCTNFFLHVLEHFRVKVCSYAVNMRKDGVYTSILKSYSFAYF